MFNQNHKKNGEMQLYCKFRQENFVKLAIYEHDFTKGAETDAGMRLV